MEMATLATIAQVAGTGMSVVGALQAGQAQAAAAQYQQQVALRNQQVQEENARQVMENTQIQQRDWGDEARQQIGQMVAQLAASGVTLEGGSAGLLRQGARRLAQRDSQRIQEDGMSAAKGLRQQAADFGAQAGFAGAEASSARSAGSLNAFSSLLSGAGQFANNRLKLKQARS